MKHTKLHFFILLFSVAATLATVARTAPAQPQTRVEADQATGTVRFIVNNREEAHIDRAGLHVRDSIEYGGTETDIGGAAYGR